MNASLSRPVALASYLALMAIVFVWEMWLAPATPVARGFWAGVKLVPLLIPLYWIARANARAHLFAALLVLVYFSEGVMMMYVAAKNETAMAFGWAVLETLAALLFIASASFYVRANLNRATVRSPG